MCYDLSRRKSRQNAALEKQVPWVEAIEQVIADSGGAVSLEKMYEGIGKYRDLSTNRDWKATLRGILYLRVIPKGRVKRIGLGVFGFADAANPPTLFQNLEAQKAVKPTNRHGDTQGMLLELGNFYHYQTYTADPSVVFDNKPLGSIASLTTLPPFTGYPALLEQAKKIDVVWMRSVPFSFPQFFYEVENTPEFGRSMLKMYQFRDFSTNFCLIADEKKRKVFESRLGKSPFHEIKERFEFRTFAEVTELYRVAVLQQQNQEAAFFAGLKR